MLADQAETLLGVEVLLKHDRSTSLERRKQHDVQAKDMGEREDAERDGVRREGRVDPLQTPRGSNSDCDD